MTSTIYSFSCSFFYYLLNQFLTLTYLVEINNNDNFFNGVLIVRLNFCKLNIKT